MVMNIRVEIETSSLARVSWDAINIPGISGYVVYYSLTENRKRQLQAEESVDVPGSSAHQVQGPAPHKKSQTRIQKY